MTCSKCNALIPDDSVFCPECGQRIEAPAPEATEIPAAPVAAEPAPEAAPAKPDVSPVEKIKEVASQIAAKVSPIISQITAKIPQKYLKIGVAAVALILVIAIISSLFAGPKVYNYSLYVKDGEVYYSEMPKGKKPVEVTSNFADDTGDYQMSTIGYYLAEYFQLSSDGKKLFYPDKVDDGYTLYCRDISNPKKDPIKIESNLEDLYHVNEKGNLVTYLKDDKLYQHNLKEKTKIASDVSYFEVSADGKTILYTSYDGDDDSYTLYIKKGNKDAEKIASDISELCHVNDDLNTVLYLKDDALYTMKVGKEATKIASDVDEVIHAYESGEVYFTKQSETEITYWDVIKDDYKDIDDWSYEYYSEWMKETSMGVEFSELCYYNGKEASTLSETVIRCNSTASEEPALVFSALDGDDLPSWSLTDYINGDVDLYDEFHDFLDENRLFYIAAESNTAALEQEDIFSAILTKDGKTLYVRADYDEDDGVTSLYQLTLNGTKVKKSEKLDEDVDTARLSVVYGKKKAHVVYFKDVEDDEGELFMDGKKIDDDVYIYSTRYNKADDTLFYFVDWDEEHGQGSLKYWGGKKATAVKDDVHDFIFTPEGECLFLYDFSDSSYRGELWILDGKKAVKLDEDVSCIIPVY